MAKKKKNLEIERKYLLKRLPTQIKWDLIINIKQYYLPDKTRIRESFTNGEYTYVKCNKTLLSKNPRVYDEVEILLAKDKFIALLKKAKRGLMKTRFIKKVQGKLKWEVDVYEDLDLVVAELEIPSRKFKIKIPRFISDVLIMDVTKFSEFTNRSLSEKIRRAK